MARGEWGVQHSVSSKTVLSSHTVVSPCSPYWIPRGLRQRDCHLPRRGTPPRVDPARRGDGAAVVVGGAGFYDRPPRERLDDGGGGSVRLWACSVSWWRSALLSCCFVAESVCWGVGLAKREAARYID